MILKCIFILPVKKFDTYTITQRFRTKSGTKLPACFKGHHSHQNRSSSQEHSKLRPSVWNSSPLLLALQWLVQMLADMVMEAFVVHLLYHILTEGADSAHMAQYMVLKVLRVDIGGKCFVTYWTDLHCLTNGIFKPVIQMTITFEFLQWYHISFIESC